jgi:murein DD-endopeptidase MepM/ murein hydrolase activator NlpD
VPQRAPYAGRHRGRHRAEVERPSRSVALPGAAAAALTLTATGVAIFPGLGASAAASEHDAATGANPRTQPADLAGERDHVASTRAQLAQAEIAERAREARAVAQARASRAQARERIEQKRRKALAAAHRWVLPVTHFRFSSDYGMRWGRLHAGDDFAAPIGTRIGSLSSGTVVFAGQQSGYGNKVEVRHWDGTVSYYAHMSSIAVQVGQRVAPGEKLSEVGNTGHSTGPHLHFEIHPDGGGPVDPAPWLAAHGLKV